MKLKQSIGYPLIEAHLKSLIEKKWSRVEIWSQWSPIALLKHKTDRVADAEAVHLVALWYSG